MEGLATTNSNSCCPPNLSTIFFSFTRLSGDDSAISSTRPSCLLKARAPISFKNWNIFFFWSPLRHYQQVGKTPFFAQASYRLGEQRGGWQRHALLFAR